MIRIAIGLLIALCASAFAQMPANYLPAVVAPPKTNFVLRIEHTAPTNTEPAVEFDVQWGPESGIYTNSVTVPSSGKVTFATVSNLSLFSSHYFVAIARDRLARESGYSVEASYVPSDPPALTNCIVTIGFEIQKTNPPGNKFFTVFSSDDLRTWKPEPSIVRVTKTNY